MISPASSFAGNEFDKVVGKRVFVDQTHNQQLNWNDFNA
jgi:hypothetical protein|tara:strand:+ start:141 stop:257 length:117 start_codon:yes stop_codon:yes gene_type:complete